MFAQRDGLMGRTSLAALAAIAIGLLAGSARAETILGSDYASNYGGSNPSWANNSNQSTGGVFGAWTLTGSGTVQGAFTGAAGAQWANYSSAGLYSSGVAFATYADANSSYNAYRSLSQDLAIGETLRFSLGFSFDNGNKGIDLYSGTSTFTGQVFNFNINSTGYSWTGGGTAAMTPWQSGGSPLREAGVVIDFAFTKTLAGFDYSFSSPQDSNLTQAGSLSGGVRTLQFYVANAGGGDGGNLYFNNQVVAVPEPAMAPLVVFGLVVPAVMSYRRMRRRLQAA